MYLPIYWKITDRQVTKLNKQIAFLCRLNKAKHRCYYANVTKIEIQSEVNIKIFYNFSKDCYSSFYKQSSRTI